MSERYIGGLVYNPPGGWSVSFNGSTQYLSVADNAAFDFAAGDFTIEAWVNFNSIAQEHMIASQWPGASNRGWVFTIDATVPQILFAYTTNGTTQINALGTYSFKASTWTHVAVCRSSTNLRLFVNGAVITTYNISTDTIYNSTASMLVGAFQSGSTLINGYMSNFRIVKGTALYTAAFTPPTGALLPISGTSILTCRYPTIVDGSTNAFTITNNGTATVSTSNPFPTSVLPNPALGGAGNGIYTLSQYASLLGAGTWPAIDPYYENVTLNLHGNAGAVLPFNTDASTNNFQVTQVGDTRPSNYTPFIANGYWSNYTAGSASAASRVDVSGTSGIFGTNISYTMEGWFLFSTTTAGDNQNIVTTNTNTYPSRWIFDANVTSTTIQLRLYTESNSIAFNGTAVSYTLGTWVHLAVVNDNTANTCTFYVNGTAAGTRAKVSLTAYSTLNLLCNSIYVSSASPLYVSNFRIVNNVAVYTGNFTPSTTPLTAISGTALLTFQSNRFIDNSASALTVTPFTGNSINPLQPFTAPTGTSAYGSGYFNGSTDYLQVSYNSALDAGTGAFTYEAWLNPSTTTNKQYLGGSVTNAFFAFVGSGTIFVGRNNVAVDFTSSSAIVINQWNHVVIVRNASNNIAIFINGTRQYYAASNTNNYGLASNSLRIGVATTGSSYEYNGYISNVLIAKSALYDPTASTITVPTSPLTAGSAGLLTVQTNAPSQNNTFLDSSTNNFTITRNGNTTQGTFSPYGSNWSNYFNGSSTYLSFASNAALAVSSSADYTVEGWINFATVAAGGVFQTTSNTTSNTGALWFGYYSGNLTVAQHGSATYNVSYAWTPTAGVWYHVAATRTSGTVRLFINGAVVTTNASTQNGVAFTQAGAAIGLVTTPSYLTGYLSNVRFVNGSSLYTAAFTPSTGPLTAVTNTVVLSCQSNRFIDTSSNNFAITANGTPTVQRFSPFNPTPAYSTSVIGGSGYFDGSGDYLVSANSAALYLSTSNFTIECWVYLTSSSSSNIIRGTAQYSIGILYSGGSLVYYISSNGSTWGIASGVSMGSVALNAWNHVALVRNGSTFTPYINGVAGTTTTSASAISATNGFYVFAEAVGPGSGASYGYCSDFRVVVGSAVYTSAFTPPTAPLTAIANTQLLLSYTNAAIFDNAMMNDLETVGNAQLSTSVKKYGSASMYFDGTGDWLTGPRSWSIAASENFTIEGWFYLTAAQANYRMIVSDGTKYFTINSAGLEIQFGGVAGTISNATYTFSQNVWYHIAVTRSSNVVTIYVNGLALTTAQSSQSAAFLDTGSIIYVSRYSSATDYPWVGYIDDLRITKGVARYTANFTPPTSQLQDQ